MLLGTFLPLVVHAQTAALQAVHVEGLKYLTEDQVIYLSGLKTGAQVGRSEMQEAADALVRTGLFSKVTFKYDTKLDKVELTFHAE